MSKALVAYFSATGRTRKIVEAKVLSGILTDAKIKSLGELC